MKREKMNVNALKCCLDKDEKVITCEEGEIGRYHTKACVIISGKLFEGSPNFYKELNLIVVTSRCCKKVSLKPGYNPRVKLFDFNGSGNDIYVTIDSGGSGGFQFFYIYEYDNCDLNLLMSDDIYNAQYNNFMGMYLDYFRGQVVRSNDVWRIDLSCKGDDYLSQIYYSDGKLIEPRQIYISGANYTFPQYNQVYERYTLVVYQRVTGLYQADGLGYMETTLKFDGNNHTAESVYFKTLSDVSSDCVIY